MIVIWGDQAVDSINWEAKKKEHMYSGGVFVGQGAAYAVNVGQVGDLVGSLPLGNSFPRADHPVQMHCVRVGAGSSCAIGARGCTFSVAGWVKV